MVPRAQHEVTRRSLFAKLTFAYALFRASTKRDRFPILLAVGRKRHIRLTPSPMSRTIPMR
jgi:hypothetical protein